MTMVGFSGISFEDQMLEFERRAREDAMRREEDKQRARDRVAALAAAQARQEAEAKARAATAAAALADAERRAATKREADIASARARDEAAAQMEAELQARRPAPGPLQATPTPRLSELLGGAGPTNPPVAARPTSVSRSTTTPRATTTSRPVSPPADRSVRPGGLEVAALELAEGGDLRAHNAARRRAFDAVPGGAETRAAIELAAAATSPSRLTADAEERLFASALAQEEAAAVAGPPSVLRQVREALNEDDKRMREAKIRDVASTVPLGLETLDAFRLERELDAREAVVRSELDEPGHPDAVPPALRRAPLPSSGTEPTSDFEAFASFSESGRRQAAAVDAVQRATGAASAREVADDLEEQSALDAAFRREMLADPGGADAVRAMDAEAADLEAMQRLEIVADPGGAAVLRSRDPLPVEPSPDLTPSPADRDAALLREMSADPGGVELVRTIQDALEPSPFIKAIEVHLDATEGEDLAARNAALRREMVADPEGAAFVSMIDTVVEDVLGIGDAGVRAVIEDLILSGPHEFALGGSAVSERLIDAFRDVPDNFRRDDPNRVPERWEHTRQQRALMNLYPDELVERARWIAEFERRGDHELAQALRHGAPLPDSSLLGGIGTAGMAVLIGADRVQNGILGFLTADDPLSSFTQAFDGLSGEETFSGGDIGFVRQFPEWLRGPSGRVVEEVADPTSWLIALKGPKLAQLILKHGNRGPAGPVARVLARLVSPVSSSSSFPKRWAAEVAFSAAVGEIAYQAGELVDYAGGSPRDQANARIIARMAAAGLIVFALRDSRFRLTAGAAADEALPQEALADALEAAGDEGVWAALDELVRVRGDEED